MGFSRYQRATILDLGNQYGTSISHEAIRESIKSGRTPFKTIILKENQRLDHIAGIEYGDSSYWWILAAASEIGWALQVPPGTLIVIPELKSILNLVA